MLANKKTLSANECKALYKVLGKMKTYLITFTDSESIKVTAMDTTWLKWFLAQEYKVEFIEAIDEIQTRYIPIDIDDLKIFILS